MLEFELNSFSFKELLQQIGSSIESDIKTQKMTKQQVAQKAGITDMSLYRLLKGENSNLLTLLRVLKAINRTDIIESLVTPVKNNLADANTSVKPKKRKSDLLTEEQKKISFKDLME